VNIHRNKQNRDHRERSAQRVSHRLARYTLLIAVALQAQNPDPHDLLARGVQLIPTKPAEAVKLLQQALRLDSELPSLPYELGRALYAIGDLAEAEIQLREAVRRAPDSAPPHNQLGIVLFQLGDAKAALEEFRAAAKLVPKDPNAHFNLGEAMTRTGDSRGAVEELRIASSLDPSDAGLARLLQGVETTIKVDVRQVLVPVVVTDAQGRHVTGLTQADFRVFEDGVEQKITGFSMESSLAVQTESASKIELPQSAPPKSAAPPQAPVRRTYMICIDTLHSTFKNFAAAREALVSLFAGERAGDSQYVVVALGLSAEMVVQVTRDPAAVLAIFQGKRLQKVFLDGQQGSVNADMERFRRDLLITRNTCNLAIADIPMVPQCESGMSRLNMRAQQIGDMDRALTIEFLRQFRALISQLARARDRRTVVLISDGFSVEPGREAAALMDAYFPFASHCLVPSQGPTAMRCVKSEVMPIRLSDEFEPILQLAARSNVVIDTIDSRGLEGQAGFDASSAGNPVNVDGAVGRTERSEASAKGNTLAEIAAATGGTNFHDNNNLLTGLQRAFADGRDYYTLAYVSTNESLDGKFRAIKVQTSDRKANVNAKRGYWAATAQ
jgi:VWFA-related protein